MFRRAVAAIFLSFVLTAFGTTSAHAATTITNPNLQYFGYYNIDGLPSGSANYIPEIDSNLGNSNVAHLAAELDPAKMAAYLQSARDHKMKAIIGMFWVFFQNSGNLSSPPARLDPSYQARWNTFVNIVRPYQNDIYGFYFDEPYWQGISANDFKTVTALIKRDFPDKAIIAVEAYPVIKDHADYLTNNDYLHDVTDYSVDYYYSTKYAAYGQSYDEYQKLYQKMKQIAGNRRIWVIPETFGDTQSDSAHLTSSFNQYLQLANSDTQVIGILNFLYPKLGVEFPLGGQDYLKANTAAYTPSLAELHKEVGKSIVFPATCAGDFNGDRSVDLYDYSIFTQNFLRSPITNSKTDMNNDGSVDLIDYSLFMPNFLHSCGT